MQDPWAAFPDAPDDKADPWAGFPDAEPVAPRKPKKSGGNSGGNAPAAPVAFSAPTATDGDTLRDGDVRVRLQGIDAPELGQVGWRRDGSQVPIGDISRQYLDERLYSPANLRLGAQATPSYGRVVAPLYNDGQDVGLGSLRAGQSFAAPDFIADPEQRFDYMEAQRLARMNRLGVHGTVTLTPQEWRNNPDYRPDRRTKAVWADMPTPFGGLTGEQEQEWMRLLHFGNADEIVSYARSVGMDTDAEYTRKWVQNREEHVGKGGDLSEFINPEVLYTKGPRQLIDPGDGAAGAGVRGVGSGLTIGALDELGAFVDTFGGTEGRENMFNSDRRFGDIYWNNLYQNQAQLAYDEENHPYASYGGQFAGALTTAFVAPYASGARSVPQLARAGAAYGGAEGFLGTDGSFSDRLTGAAIGAPIGFVADPALGKLVDTALPAAGRLASKLFRSGGGTQGGPVPSGVGAGQPINGPTTMAMADTIDPALALEVGRASAIRPLMQPNTRADLMASTSTLQPRDMLPLPNNMVDFDEGAAINAGRFGIARADNESTALDRQSVVNWRGEPVPKVGPLDLVGFLRSRGGLQDYKGELASLGITGNAARRGMDHVGQEARFGPLVDPEGMTLDDAAMAAWEAGYFPEGMERPDVNTFLDALGETYNGGAGRRFLPEDQPQLEAFDAMRAERYDLEQQRFENDGPIYEDRSGAAGERAFPPIGAYEEWPSDAIGRVGNIDVAKLDTPQDIRRALKQTYNAVGGFDAATRGRIANAETERLASELGMTADQLLARRKGQAFNAEEALASRQILAKSSNELVNAARRIQRMDDPGADELAAFREKLVRHVAIQEQVSGMTAEAGRTLQQFRMAANSRAVQDEVLNAFVRSGGGKGDLKEAAQVLLDAVEMGPGKFNTLADQITKPKWRDKISELYINSLLSNPPTHAVNMVSNTITAIGQIPEYAFASGIGAARRAIMGEKAAERITASEVCARTFGLIQGTREGMQLFAKALRTGEADDFVSKVEGDQYKAISGIKGEIIRIPTRLLTAEDQLFKGMARRMELNAQALRIANREGLKGKERAARVAELAANPTDDMLDRAMDYGRYLTFQRPLGEFGQGLSRITASNLPAKVVVPFVRTPINLLKFATERSPAAPLLKEWRADFAAGGERRDLAIARAVIGTGLATTFYQMAQEGLITGSAPPDPAKARLMYANGWQPYSIKIGDRYVSYSRLDPLSTTMGVAADMATLPEGLSERQRDDQATMLVASIMGNLASKTWLSGVSSLVEGLSDPQRHAGNWLERTVSSFAVPAGVAGAARQIDPVARKRESVGEAIMARIPGLSDNLLPQRDVFGEVRETDSLGPDFLSPFWQTKDKGDPVIAEMLRIGKSVSGPGKQHTVDGERVDYTPEQYDRYHEIAGRHTYNNLLALIGSAEYSRMNDAQKSKAAAKAIRDARATARGVLNDADYPVPPKASYKGQPASDAWGDFPDADGEGEGDPWADFPDAEQRDVVGSLQRAIPGVGISSGYRTREYQDDMRRRGYKPAENSAHLDGSALDLVPPRGMSMQQLMARVQQIEPDAYLLPEGDHLHVEFPGWQGAPALGGAASAGLRNPVGGR